MSATPAISKNIQARIPKNIVLDLEWFNGDQTKFKDQWRGMRLFFKSNRVIETNDRITGILACFREGVVGIYAQKKLNKLDKELGTQNWKDFVKEIKTTLSDKTKAVNAKWKIESFKQGKKNIIDFIIKFDVLAIKTDTDELYAIFLLKKNA